MYKYIILSHLQDFPGDVLLAAFTLDAVHGVVVLLAVGDPIPARTSTHKVAQQFRMSRLMMH